MGCEGFSKPHCRSMPRTTAVSISGCHVLQCKRERTINAAGAWKFELGPAGTAHRDLGTLSPVWEQLEGRARQ